MRDSDPRPGALRVLHVITTAQRRGAETFAVDLDLALRRAGAASSTLALRGAAAGSPTLPVPVLDPAGGSPLRQLVGLRRALRDVDVAVAHGSRSLPLCAAATVGTGTPFVYRVIGESDRWASTRLRRLRVGVQLRRAAAVVTYYDRASDAVAQRYRIDRARVHTIAKGLDAREHQAPSEAERAMARASIGVDGPLVLALGALAPEKDLALAIEAASLLPGVTLALVGDGPLRAELAARADALGVAVLLPGATQDPRRWLVAADALLLTSRTEGVPGVLLEAALAGTPAVAVDVGGVRHAVQDAVTGAVVPSRDAGSIAVALRSVLADRDRLGAAARSRCLATADIDAVAGRWLSMLRSVAP